MKTDEQVHILSKYARMYSTYTVAGETSRSWLIVPQGQQWIVDAIIKNPTSYHAKYATKLAKAGQAKGDWRLGTEADVALNKWAVEHRYKVKERIDWQSDEVVLAIAKLVGYPTPEDSK